MRRVLVGAATVLTVAACGQGPTTAGTRVQPVVTGRASPSLSGTPVDSGDPLLTRRLCSEAAIATAAATSDFHAQLAVLERAAAKGDQDGLVAAAEAINGRLTALAVTLAAMAQRSVTTSVKKLLSDAARALADISSPGYPGTTSDIATMLGDFVTGFAQACSRAAHEAGLAPRDRR